MFMVKIGKNDNFDGKNRSMDDKTDRSDSGNAAYAGRAWRSPGAKARLWDGQK
jgi:hypothetical protein